MRHRRFGQIKHGKDIGAERLFELHAVDFFNAAGSVLFGSVIDEQVKLPVTSDDVGD